MIKASKIRGRDLGIPFSGTPGPNNAITDVKGVEVGYATLWSGRGKVVVGEGPVRTGVTAILPRGKRDHNPCFGGAFALNAAGEMTGLTWLEERGLFEGPILVTNTHSVGTVRDAAIKWMKQRGWRFEWTVPIVGETYDGLFNDIDGAHINFAHVFAALDEAHGGGLNEGNVGGGAGMITYEYKGGTGTSSRKLPKSAGGHTVGVIVQANYGLRRNLRIGGIPLGNALSADLPRYLNLKCVTGEMRQQNPSWVGPTDGSIIVVVATDAPVMPHQLKRIAKRPALAIGRLGGVGAATSGDIFVAFSTANPRANESFGEGYSSSKVHMFPNLALTAIFEATIDATEEAIVNALVAAEAAEGSNYLFVPRLPHARLRKELRRHRVLREN